MKTQASSLVTQNKSLVRLTIVTGLSLLVPLIATQLSDEVTWTPFDFVVMAVLILIPNSLA